MRGTNITIILLLFFFSTLLCTFSFIFFLNFVPLLFCLYFILNFLLNLFIFWLFVHLLSNYHILSLMNNFVCFIDFIHVVLFFNWPLTAAIRNLLNYILRVSICSWNRQRFHVEKLNVFFHLFQQVISVFIVELGHIEMVLSKGIFSFVHQIVELVLCFIGILHWFYQI